MYIITDYLKKRKKLLLFLAHMLIGSINIKYEFIFKMQNQKYNKFTLIKI